MSIRFKILVAVVVLVIMLLAAAVTLPRVVQRSDQHPKTDKAHFDLALFDNQLDVLKQDIARYPTTAEGLAALLTRPPTIPAKQWLGPYVVRIDLDPWGHPYIYRQPSTRPHHDYDLASAGPDGIPDTSDDISPP